jgi:hypothetical protein
MENCPTCHPLERRERSLLALVAATPLVLVAGALGLFLIPADPSLPLQVLALVVALLSAASAVLLVFLVVGGVVALKRPEHDRSCRARTILTSASLPFSLVRDGGH